MCKNLQQQEESTLAQAHVQALQDIKATNAKLQTLHPTLPEVATMTIGCQACEGPLPIPTDEVIQHAMKSSCTPFQLGTNRFRNSILLSIPKPEHPGRKYGIKIFKNGAVHLTGLKDFAQLSEVVTKVEQLLDDAVMLGGYRLGNFCMQLANSNFKLGQRLNLAVVNRVLSKHEHIFSHGVGTNYPALVIKIPMEGATASVHLFSTGSVLISGVKHPCHISRAYDAIVPILDMHAHTIRMRL